MPNHSRYPLLMIGLDALDCELVGRWAREGALPGFARLYQEAAQGGLSSPTGVMQGSIWPSFTTGLDPSGHGLYFMAQLTPDHAGLRRMQAKDLTAPVFWNRSDPPSDRWPSSTCRNCVCVGPARRCPGR